MRRVPDSLTEAWLSEDKTGPKRAVVRATITKSSLKRYPYDTRWAPGGDMEWDEQRPRMGNFTSILFGVNVGVREIRNILSYSWSRSVEQDVATCTIRILNTELTPIGNLERTEFAEDFDMPGFMTPNRGSELSQERWGFEESGWEDFYVPDRVVKTYEGYGQDLTQPPGLDPNLVPSGTWLIDTVTIGHDGNIELSMRDIGRLLLDQISFPPVIPYDEYPVSWDKIHSELVPGRQPTGGEWSGKLNSLGSANSSNQRYVTKFAGKEDPGTGKPYVTQGGGVWGHYDRDAITKVPDEPEPIPGAGDAYWLSTGQSRRWDKVWWEFAYDKPRAVSAVRLNVMGGPYRIYISVMDGKGRWHGRKKIDYDVSTKNVNLRADKPFVATAIADRGKTFDVVLKQVHKKIKRVRITFTKLWDTSSSEEFPWRAGLKNIYIYQNKDNDPDASDMGFERGNVRKIVGNYLDYTDIVKTAVCWGGFFWPSPWEPNGTGDDHQNFIRLGATSDPTGETPGTQRRRVLQWTTPDPHLARGRAWGDFMLTGTAGEETLGVDQFDKQPLMDMISYVRDVTGFVFFIDETGAVVWRMPNYFKKGNYLSPPRLGVPTRGRTQDFITLDEDTTLLEYSTILSSESNREVIFVANLTGNFGTAIEGYAPSGAHLRRTAGWTDGKFRSKRETTVMADMIATQQMFAYRRGQARTPGNPAIQIDDQIRIFERVTSETYFHYVMGIEAELNMESGEFFYNLDTHWLGESEETWMLKQQELAGVTQQYLNRLGMDDDHNELHANVLVWDEDDPGDAGTTHANPIDWGDGN